MTIVNEDRVDILSRSPVFKELPGEVLAAIAQAVEPLVVAGHSIIFREGDPGDSLYIISSGSARIFRKNEAGMDMDLSIRGLVKPGRSAPSPASWTADVGTGRDCLLALQKTLIPDEGTLIWAFIER
jgi:hypothetical protein